ncbi:MAG: hypothetical protein O2894_04760 [Planctomycetota bacterium]|nr:hypothetical protein [Planctomycetota bacterium]
MRALRLGLILASALLWAPCVAAEEYAATDTALRTEYVAALEDLGQWCIKEELFAARDELAETILTIDPDHDRARAWLRYKRAKDGSWERRGTYKPPTDRQPKSRPEFESRRAALIAALGPRVVAAIRDATPALSFAQRTAAVAAWRALLGDVPDLLALAGMERHEGRWLGTETVRTLKRRAALRRVAAEALAERPTLTTPALPADLKDMELPWRESRGTKRVNVHGTASSDTLAAVARLVHATEALMAEQLGSRTDAMDGFTFCIMQGREHFQHVVEKHPDVRGDRSLLRDLSGAYLGYGKFLDLMDTQQGTLDSCVSVTTQHLLGRRVGEGRSEWMPGWVADGFALYNMTWLTGTHLSYTVDFGRYGQDPLFKSLFRSGTDWMAEARALMLSPDPATLRLSLGLKIGRLGPRDFLASYAFVAWLIEAREPREVDALLRALVAGQDQDTAFATALGMTVEEAEARLIRWLRETGDA